MTKILRTIILLIITINSFAQVKIDTLFIGNKKYPLKKTSIYHLYETGSVSLPSEYQKITNYFNGKIVKYKECLDSIDRVEIIEDGPEEMNGTEIMVRIPRDKQLPHQDVDLFCFVDTLKITYKEFSNFKLFIKSNNRKTYFSAFKVNYLYKDTLGEVNFRNIFSGDIFSFWNTNNASLTDEELIKLKQTTFILRGLFYVRKNATYYLDREFIILIK